MRRIPIPPRPNLKQSALAHGFAVDEFGNVPYWDETAYYCFTLRQIEEDLEHPAEAIEELCFEILDRAIADETVFHRLRIPEAFWDYIASSWRNREKDLIGRFDFSYDGTGPAKLLEYNADTPTTLYEACEFQWEWIENTIERGLVSDTADQFNLLHEFLLAAFTKFGINGPLHLACQKHINDDRDTVEYLEELAKEAGLETVFLSMDEVGIDPHGRFTDLDDQIITWMFKLYPWEWLMEESFGQYIPASGARFIEPPWKGVLSNKGLLPLLWESFKGHPNLLPSYFEGDPRAAEIGGNFVRKPLLSRRGANIDIVRAGDIVAQKGGPYGEEGYIVQAFHPLPDFDGRRPVLGCWMVAGDAAALGIREDSGLVTTDDAVFMPHIILD
ncbi:MAG: glutathionylspermidine synthase family protein [Rhodospirillales bacterium]|jgi:glutathionylspermidine synthase